MKLKITLAFAFLFLAIGSTFAQSIFSNPITGNNPNTNNPFTNGQFHHTNISVSGITRSISLSGFNANDRYTATGWNSTTQNPNAYFEFQLTPNSEHKISFSTFEYTGQTSPTGPTSFSLRSNSDNFSSEIGLPTATGNSIDLSANQYQNVTNSITFRLYAWNATGSSGNWSINDFSFNGQVFSTDFIQYCNLQFPANATINVGSSATIYAQVFKDGVTNFSGQGSGINAWIGYSSTNSNPNGADWTWIPATYNTDVGANDEYQLSLGNQLPPGTYYYASRFAVNGSSYFYGGFQNGFWNGTSNVNGVLTINDTKVDYCNLQTPADGTQFLNENFNVYAQVFEPNVTPGLNNQGSNIQAWIGFSSQNTNPNNSDWTWIPATFNALGGGANNDEYLANIGNHITSAGVYYYASRFQLGSGTYSYGGILSNGTNGNFWDGNTYISGKLTVQTRPEINVKGNGISIASNSLNATESNHTDFTGVFINSTRNFTIENSGTASLSGLSVAISGENATDFTVSSQPESAINGVGFTVFSITFNPNTDGIKNAIVTISSNDADENPYVFAIIGNASPEILIHGTLETNTIISGAISVSSLNNTNFGTTDVGSSIDKVFTIKNLGNRPLTLNEITPYIQISGSESADFSVISYPNSNVILPNSSSQFTVRFTALGTGFRNAKVTISTNDGDENPFVFAIQGKAKEAEIDVRGNMISIPNGANLVSTENNTLFPNTPVNSISVANDFVIINFGDGNLTVSNPVLSGPNASDFSIISNPSATISGNSGHSSFSIVFNPISAGEKLATVTIINSDLDENPYSFQIKGTGINYAECNSSISQNIGIQDFESISSVQNLSFSTLGNATIATGNGFATSLDSGNSMLYIGTKSLQVANNEATIVFDPINTQQFTDIDLNLRIGAFSVSSYANGMDSDDYIMVSVSQDGINFSDEIKISGNSNAKWSFISGIGIASASYDNNNTVEFSKNFAPSSGGYAAVDGYSELRLSNLPSVPNLTFKIKIKNNNVEELWAIDNVVIRGKSNSSKTWNGTNWLNNLGEITAIPIATEKVIIAADYDSTGNLPGISACKCVINENVTVKIASDETLEIQSDLTNNGNIIIENGGSLLQHNDFATNLGQITLKRNSQPMYRYDFTYWSSPLTLDSNYKLGNSDLSIPSLSPETLFDKYFKWNSTSQSWNTIPYGNETMVPGCGYVVRAPQNYSTSPYETVVYQAIFQGKPTNGEVLIPIIGGTEKWNLIGNPYPSAINASLFLSNSLNTEVLDGTIYLWTHNSPPVISVGPETYNYTSNDYATYNFSGGTITALSAISETNPTLNMPNGFIASGQSFFIKGINNGTAFFNNAMRVSNNNNQFFRLNVNDNQNFQNLERHRIWLHISNNQDAFNQALVGYIENATDGFDRGFDGEVLGGNYVTLYSLLEGKNMTIQGRSLPFELQDQVKMGFKVAMSGQFKIGIDHFDGLFETQNIYLEDKFLHVIHDLKQSDYEFESEIGTFDSRFILRYTNQALGEEDFASIQNDVFVFTKDKKLTVNSSKIALKEITAYDILGRILFKNTAINSNHFSASEITQNQQPIVLKIVLENGTIVTRKVIL